MCGLSTLQWFLDSQVPAPYGTDTLNLSIRTSVGQVTSRVEGHSSRMLLDRLIEVSNQVVLMLNPHRNT